MTEFQDGFPRKGKIVILSPTNAAKIAEQVPHHAERIYTMPSCPDDAGYVVDMDAMNENFEIPDDPYDFNLDGSN